MLSNYVTFLSEGDVLGSKVSNIIGLEKEKNNICTCPLAGFIYKLRNLFSSIYVANVIRIKPKDTLITLLPRSVPMR